MPTYHFAVSLPCDCGGLAIDDEGALHPRTAHEQWGARLIDAPDETTAEAIFEREQMTGEREVSDPVCPRCGQPFAGEISPLTLATLGPAAVGVGHFLCFWEPEPGTMRREKLL